MDISIRIGGEAGQGIQSIGELLLKIFSHMGFWLFSHQDYMSRVRGGNNFYQVRIADRPVHSSREKIELLLALNQETARLWEKDLTPDGLMLLEGSLSPMETSGRVLQVPFTSLAKEAGAAIYANTVATGSLLGMLGFSIEGLGEVVKSGFLKKGEAVAEQNWKAFELGYLYAKRECLTCAFHIAPPAYSKRKILSGNQAIAWGAILSGVKFYSAYPMTPSTGILNHLAANAMRFGIVVEQAEDEISAINMVLGASFGGVRAMTGSSGGGFALMVEGLSLAAMTETPIVIAEVQRPGPATGLPTRTEQGDLLFVLFTGHGEFPRVCFAPGDPEQAIYLTNKAFDMAERFQIPCFIISDQYLADSTWSIKEIEWDRIVYKDYRIKNADSNYLRHKITPDGVSPLAIPGFIEGTVVTDSDEHDEEGHIIESASIRKQMVEKRLYKKLPHIRKEISPPVYYGPKVPKVVLVGWGSTLGVLLDVTEDLNKDIPTGLIHFTELWPFPEIRGTKVWEAIERAELKVGVENNASGQFAWLMKAETGIALDKLILRYDGRPFYSDQLREELNGTLSRP